MQRAAAMNEQISKTENQQMKTVLLPNFYVGLLAFVEAGGSFFLGCKTLGWNEVTFEHMCRKSKLLCPQQMYLVLCSGLKCRGYTPCTGVEGIFCSMWELRVGIPDKSQKVKIFNSHCFDFVCPTRPVKQITFLKSRKKGLGFCWQRQGCTLI